MPLVLIERLSKGSKLTPAEMDGNLTAIENAINGFAAQISVALNADGTLKNNSVATAAIQDRAVTLAKLAFLSEFYAVDGGAANALAITFGALPLAAYAAGLVFWVKAAASITGGSTLKVDTLAAVAIKKFDSTGLVDLVLGDIIAAGVYVFVHDGTQFILLNPTPPKLVSGINFITPNVLLAFNAATTWRNYDISAALAGILPRFAILYLNGIAAETIFPAPNECQFTTSFRSSVAGLVYLGPVLAGGAAGGGTVSLPVTGQYIVPVDVTGAVVSFEAQVQLTQASGVGGETVSLALTLIGYAI